ncbi:MAG: SagB/ThcOx family dehydrogenase [Elusimicrobia bacterium]|nr:SagB/ThcOx family dehydrogenase [Elusimicrobiota bacterium]
MANTIKLPEPVYKSSISVEEAILKRRSVRDFSNKKLPIELISQLLWSAQGITDKTNKFRAAPSAGALYPMELYIVSPDGIFHYIPDGHRIQKLQGDDLRQDLANACWGQNFVAVAGISIIIAADYGRTTWRYGNKGIRYVDIEAGHIAQNIHLQSVALNLGSVPVGAFNDKAVKSLLKLPAAQQPIYVIPVGYPVRETLLPETPENEK